MKKFVSIFLSKHFLLGFLLPFYLAFVVVVCSLLYDFLLDVFSWLGGF